MNNHSVEDKPIWSGTFDPMNDSLMQPLNQVFYDEFAAKLTVKSGTCGYIHDACAAGACLRVACSGSFQVQQEICRDKIPVEAHIKDLVLHDLARHIENILAAVRMIDSDESHIVYAAAVILRHETNFFSSSLKYEFTFNHVRKSDTLSIDGIDYANHHRFQSQHGCC